MGFDILNILSNFFLPHLLLESDGELKFYESLAIPIDREICVDDLYFNKLGFKRPKNIDLRVLVCLLKELKKEEGAEPGVLIFDIQATEHFDINWFNICVD